MPINAERFFPGLKETWDFAKIGVVLYGLGLFVNFLHLVQWHVPSGDLVKPAAILIGIYVWLLADTIPRALRYLLSGKTSILSYILFVILLLIVYGLCQIFTAPDAFVGGIFAVLMTGCACISFWKEPGRAAAGSTSGLGRSILFIPVSLSLYPNIPQYLGGGHPLEVKVCPADMKVMLSQFSSKTYDRDSCIAANLLFEGDKDYYFIDLITTSHVEQVVEYRVHKVRKDLIKKIIYLKSNWIPFN
jgi:hypothetical protein